MKEMEHWKISPPAEPKESKHKHSFFFLTSLHLLSAVALAQRKLTAGRGTGRVRGRCSVEQTVDRRGAPSESGVLAASCGRPRGFCRGDLAGSGCPGAQTAGEAAWACRESLPLRRSRQPSAWPWALAAGLFVLRHCT